MTRDEVTAKDLRDLATATRAWQGNVDDLAQEAFSQGAHAHANLYATVEGHLRIAASAITEAANLMDPELTEAEDFA